MTTPISGTPAFSSGCERKLGTLARKWAYLVSMSSYIPLSHDEIEQRLLDLTHEVFDAAATEPVDTARATAVGEQLVRLHCVGEASLRASIELLTSALLADEQLRRTGDLAQRVTSTLAAVACGYADTVRWQTIEQQDGLNQALLEAAANAEQRRKDSEAERDEASTELALLRNELSHQLLHDVLTALPNRQFFTTRLEHVLNTGSPTTLYQLEINGLATICAGLGRQAWVRILRLAADRLNGVLAEAHAMVAHLQEGRFGILVEHKGRAPDPAPVVEAINAALAEPAYIDGLAVILSASTGVVQSPPYGRDPVAVLHAADLALHKAKRTGQERWALLEPSLEVGDRQEPRLAATLPHAWHTGRVHVMFRPQHRLADGEPARIDALLRWDHAELGSLKHERCVSLAERVGLGARLGRWLLDRAAERFGAWRGELPLTVAVSPTQATDPDLLAAVHRAGLAVERLQVSVPAGLATCDPVARNLASLAAAGVEIAVHDFGGTAGDATCLSDVPVRTVRLLPDLVRRSAERVTGRALRHMVALAHDAGATVVVDGLRREAEADWWRDAGADLATGPVFTLPANFQPPSDA